MSRRELIASLVFLAGVTAIGTYFAARVFPLWDDSMLETIVLSEGPERLSDFILDRPLAGQIWEWIYFDPSSLIAKGVILHWLTCFGISLATFYFAAQLFPHRPILALSAACLSATTVLCRTQVVLVVQPVSPGISTVTTLLAISLIAGTISSRLPSGNVLMRWLAAIVVLVFGGFVSEYFVASALAGVVWLLTLGWFGDTGARMRSFRAALVLLVLTVVIYLIYHQLASADARSSVRPESILVQALGWRIRVVLPQWLSSLYAGCIGALLERIGSLR